MTYCSQCGQEMPKPRFRIVNGPAKLLFMWPALDLLAYATLQPVMPLYGAALAVGTVFTAAVYAWIGLSGR
jgi:hypothetical protein